MIYGASALAGLPTGVNVQGKSLTTSILPSAPKPGIKASAKLPGLLIY